jgi:hypothetical protein
MQPWLNPQIQTDVAMRDVGTSTRPVTAYRDRA